MPDDTPQDTPAPAPQEPVQPAEPAEDGLGDAGKKALDAERRAARAAAKERDALAAKLQEFEDRDKTEAQKLIDRAEAAEKRAAEVEGRALRLEVASEKGLTPAQVKYLNGATREELEANADQILVDFKAATPSVPDLDLGLRGNGKPEPSTPHERINAGLAAHMK